MSNPIPPDGQGRPCRWGCGLRIHDYTLRQIHQSPLPPQKHPSIHPSGEPPKPGWCNWWDPKRGYDIRDWVRFDPPFLCPYCVTRMSGESKFEEHIFEQHLNYRETVRIYSHKYGFPRLGTSAADTPVPPDNNAGPAASDNIPPAGPTRPPLHYSERAPAGEAAGSRSVPPRAPTLTGARTARDEEAEFRSSPPSAPGPAPSPMSTDGGNAGFRSSPPSYGFSLPAETIAPPQTQGSVAREAAYTWAQSHRSSPIDNNELPKLRPRSMHPLSHVVPKVTFAAESEVRNIYRVGNTAPDTPKPTSAGSISGQGGQPPARPNVAPQFPPTPPVQPPQQLPHSGQRVSSLYYRNVETPHLSPIARPSDLVSPKKHERLNTGA